MPETKAPRSRIGKTCGIAQLAGMSSPNSFGQLDLSILGVGTEYPPHSLKPEAVRTLAERFHNADGDAMKKVLSINRFTGIEVGNRCKNMYPIL